MIVGYALFICTRDTIDINGKLVLTIPQCILYVVGIFSSYHSNREKKRLQFVKLENRYLLFTLLATIIANGNIGISFLLTEETKVNGGLNPIIIIGQICYWTSYLAGYYAYSYNIVEKLRKESNNKKPSAFMSASLVGSISGLLYLSVRNGNIVSKIILFAIIGIGVMGILFILGTVWARNDFFCKLYEKELR